MPGVLAVLTGEEAREDGLKAIPHLGRPRHATRHRAAQPRRLAGSGRAPSRAADRPGPPCRHRRSLRDRRDRRRGKDAAERIVVEYEPLPTVIDAKAAVEGTRRGSTTTCRIS